MALPSTATRAASRTHQKYRRWLLASAAIGAAGYVAVERVAAPPADDSHDSLDHGTSGHSQLMYLRDRAVEASVAARHASSLLATLATSAVSSTISAMRGMPHPPGEVSEAMAAAIADLAADPSQQPLLLAWGGGLVMDWLLGLACPDPSASDGADVDMDLRRAPVASASADEGAGGGDSDWGGPHHTPSQRAQHEAERAVLALLSHDDGAAQLLARPGAVPRLLLLAHAQSRRASPELAAWLWRRAPLLARGGEATAADLEGVVGMLRRSHDLQLQRLAAAFLGAWVRGGAANRAKLGGVGLHGALSAAISAASGTDEASALQLQADLLSVVHALALHSDGDDAHALAACVQPVLYAAADAAVLADERLAALAVDTLALALRNGGEPVAQLVQPSGLVHLLWQLAEGMGACKPPRPGSAKGSKAAGQAAKQAQAHASGANSAAALRAAAAAEAAAGAPAAAAAAGGAPAAAGGGAKAAAVKPVKGDVQQVVIQIKGPAMVVSVASCVGQLARCSLLPETHVPRWRDWLLDVLCFSDDEGGGGAPAAARGPGPGSGRPLSGDQAAAVRGAAVDALSALSSMAGPGHQGLQAAHYWLSRLLSQLAARTLPYTSLLYAEGPSDPSTLVNAVPVLPSYVRAVSDALERAADAVVVSEPAPPPPLEFDLAVGTSFATDSHKKKPAPKPGPAQAEAAAAAAAAATPAAAAAAARGQRQAAGAARSGSAAVQPGAGAAAAVLAASGGEGSEVEEHLHVVDVVMAEKRAADALEALCAIVAPDPGKQRWLLQRGVLPLLQRLTRSGDNVSLALPEEGQPGSELYEAALGASPEAEAGHAGPGSGPAAPSAGRELYSDHEGGPALCLQRQVARLLAMLALLPEAAEQLSAGAPGLAGVAAAAGGGPLAQHPTASLVAAWLQRVLANLTGGVADNWVGWLQHAAASTDCRLSSHATRALLNLAALKQRQQARERAAAAAHGSGSGADGSSAAVGAEAAPVFLDGLHLLDPGAPYHWALVREAVAATAHSAALAPHAQLAHSRSAPATHHVRVHSAAEAAPTPAPAPQREQRHAGAAVQAASSAAARPAAAPEPATHGSSGPSMLGYAYSALQAGASILLWPFYALLPHGTTATAAHGGAGGAGPAGTLVMTADAAGGVGAMQPQQPAPAAATPHSTGGLPPTASPPRLRVSWVDHKGAGDVADPGRDAPPHHALPGGPQQQQPGSPSSRASAAPPAPAASAQAMRDKVEGALGPLLQAVPPLDLDPFLGAESNTASELGGAQAAGPPLVDVVFVHGLRGGPFITWRTPDAFPQLNGAGVSRRTRAAAAAAHMERDACWPAAWLAEDHPRARLLSVEYLAPVSAWEGESLPLEDNVSRVMQQLAAAGVGSGSRPVVFVAHSLGGLLVKELLARSLQGGPDGPYAALAPSTRGVVFYGTPHFGNTIAAMGWKLRHLPGALPAPSLARLTPGPHLMELNAHLQQLYNAGSVQVVSILEGRSTNIAGIIPKILIVPPESAYPGFGAGYTASDQDHISVCKPPSKEALGYEVVRDMVADAIRTSTIAAGAATEPCAASSSGGGSGACAGMAPPVPA